MTTKPPFIGRAKNIPKRDALMLPYQAKYIRDKSRLVIVEKSRQIGFSWSVAYKLVSTTPLKTATFDDWVSSRDDLQARLLIEDCKHFSSILHVGAKDMGEVVVDETKNSAHVLQYANGHRTHSLSSNPDAQAGKRGRRVGDEFAVQPDPRKWYAIAYPGITWGGSMELISTHRGSQNFFNELINEIVHKGNPKNFSHHRVTLQDALDQGFLYKLQLKLAPEDERQGMDEADYYNFIRTGCPDDDTFMQEFMCVPSDDNSAFLSYDLIASCEYKPTEKWKLDEAEFTGQLFIGVDVGRDHDLTVIWVLEKLGDTFYTRRCLTMQNKTFAEQEEVLYEILAWKNVRRCCIDRTGLGRQFAERAKKRFGSFKVEEVNFTAEVKEGLAYPLLAAFQDKSIRVPNDSAVRADLRAIKKETTTSGNIRFTADRGKNGHSDRFWAVALALHAGKRPAGGCSTLLPSKSGSFSTFAGV